LNPPTPGPPFAWPSGFGPIPLYRIRTQPPPGPATEVDVFELHDRENRLFELVDGILVEKLSATFPPARMDGKSNSARV
jgi:hypothetical protein